MPSSPTKPPSGANRTPAAKAAAKPGKSAGREEAKPKVKASGAAAAGQPKAKAKDAQNFLVYPPDSPVDVPNLPPAHPRKDEAAAQSQPRENPKAESNWADDDLPAPKAKNARSSLL